LGIKTSKILCYGENLIIWAVGFLGNWLRGNKLTLETHRRGYKKKKNMIRRIIKAGSAIEL